MNWMTAIAVNLLVPLLGVIIFALLCRRMQRTHVPLPPFFSCFILFAIFGGWLMVCLTALFWKWSGMASLGVFSLILVAPFVTAGVAFSLRNRRTLSAFHRSAYIASIAYSGLALTALAGRLGAHLLIG
jgi:O-antigen ligase